MQHDVGGRLEQGAVFLRNARSIEDKNPAALVEQSPTAAFAHQAIQLLFDVVGIAGRMFVQKDKFDGEVFRAPAFMLVRTSMASSMVSAG